MIRLRAYLGHFPLFFDEALLEQNLLAHSWSQLWQPLDFAQTAPPLFLVAEKALASAFGYGERTLRALSLLAGCLLLPLTWFVSRQLLEKEESMLVVALLALSPTAIYYDNFLKQYSSDMLASLAIIGVTLPALKDLSSRKLFIVGITGAICLLFSSTSLFLLAGAGTTLLARAVRSRAPRALLTVSGMVAAWLGIQEILLHTAYRRLDDAASPVSRYMRDYWRRDFLFNSPHSLERALSHLFDGAFFSLPGDEAFGVRAMALATLLVLGTLMLARKHGRELTALLAVPLVLLLCGSIAGRYPLGTRLVLFTTPLTALYVAAGAGAVVRRLPQVGRVGLVGALLLSPALMGFFLLRHPLAPAANADTELIGMAKSWSAGSDAVYLRGRELPIFVYYARADTAIGRRLFHLIDQESSTTLFADVYHAGNRLPAVPDSALVAQVDTRTVIVGRPRLKADASWGAREALRIKASAPCTDVYAGPVVEESAALSVAIQAIGGVITRVRRVGSHTSFRACYPAIAG